MGLKKISNFPDVRKSSAASYGVKQGAGKAMAKKKGATTPLLAEGKEEGQERTMRYLTKGMGIFYGKRQSSSVDDHTAYLVFPDDQAAVRILEILAPLSPEVRKLTLDIVQVNHRYPDMTTWTRGDFHQVLMPEPLKSRASRSNEDWREPVDPLAEFLTDCCVIDPSFWVPTSSLLAEYEAWCKRTGDSFPIPRKVFLELLSFRFQASRHWHITLGNCRTWTGLALKGPVKK